MAQVVGPAEERRPEVLRALVRFNVPAARPRCRLLQDAAGNSQLVAAVLANPRWPVAEQLELLRGAEGHEVLAWLARLDPDVEVGWAQVLGERAGAAGAVAAPGETPVAAETVERRPLPWRLDSHPPRKSPTWSFASWMTRSAFLAAER